MEKSVALFCRKIFQKKYKKVLKNLLTNAGTCVIIQSQSKRKAQQKEGKGRETKMKVTRTWKVYGRDGHRQKESFSPSYTWDFSEDGNARIIEVENSDKTGTNDYSIVRITRNTAEECERELWGQISDGIFENVRCGVAVEI